MLVLTRKIGQTLYIGDDVQITITEISGDKVKIGIKAPISVNVARAEVLQTASENEQAVKKVSSVAMRSLAEKLAKNKGIQ